MSKTTTNTKGLLDWIIKLASLVITVPVTWTVAQSVYGSGLFAIPILLSAVALVDALLLYSWYMLDYHPELPPEQKWRHTLTVGILYAGLLILSGVHNEGVAGWVFRAALGIALANSVFNAHAQTWRDLVDKSKRGARSDWRVQRHNRKLSREEAMYIRENEGMIVRAQSKKNTHVQLEAIMNDHEQPPTVERSQPVHENVHHEQPTPLTANTPNNFDVDEFIEEVRDILEDEPGISKAEIARQMDVSRSTLYKYWDRVRSGNGYHGE